MCECNEWVSAGCKEHGLSSGVSDHRPEVNHLDEYPIATRRLSRSFSKLEANINVSNDRYWATMAPYEVVPFDKPTKSVR